MDIVEQLRRDEGVRNKVYTDSRGIETIGVGRNLRDVGLTDEEVNHLLLNDIGRVRAQLAPFSWYSALDGVRQGAIENMCFNLGVGGLLHFPHMIAALKENDWNEAADEMLNSEWMRQVGDRAERLAQQIRTGVWV